MHSPRVSPLVKIEYLGGDAKPYCRWQTDKATQSEKCFETADTEEPGAANATCADEVYTELIANVRYCFNRQSETFEGCLLTDSCMWTHACMTRMTNANASTGHQHVNYTERGDTPQQEIQPARSTVLVAIRCQWKIVAVADCCGTKCGTKCRVAVTSQPIS